MARRGRVRLGVAGLGWARLGKAGRGTAWHGKGPYGAYTKGDFQVAKKYRLPESLIDRLQKGDEILRDEIEPLLPEHHGEDAFRLHLMAWVAHLDKALRKAGKPFTIRTREMGRRVEILTDEQASQYNRSRFGSYLHRASRRHALMMEVNTANLSPDQQKAHDRSVCLQGAIMTGISITAREFSPRPHRRGIPSLITQE